LSREDIKTCQTQYGKTILLSIGGATYTERGFTSESAAQTAADTVWSLFGSNSSSSSSSPSSTPRPFGSAVIDGFDLDFETATQNMVPFAQRLRDHMDADTSKKYFLSAAPQCPFPDVADNAMLDGTISFDFVMVQFYNNYCGIQSFVAGTAAQGPQVQNNFNFGTWDNWAKTASRNKNVKILLGIPANVGAGNGYQPATAMAPIIQYSKQFSSFGGVMVSFFPPFHPFSSFIPCLKCR
jgi:chitinase